MFVPRTLYCTELIAEEVVGGVINAYEANPADDWVELCALNSRIECV